MVYCRVHNSISSPPPSLRTHIPALKKEKNRYSTGTCVGYLINVKGHGIPQVSHRYHTGITHKNKVPKKHETTRKREAATQTKSQQGKKLCNRGRHSKKLSDLRKKIAGF